eukprot:2597717-Rhodomonas_salina.9
MEAIDEGDLSLLLVRKFLSGEQECAALRGLQALPWFRVKYESHRFGNACETPCWTNYFGGVHGIEPWQPIPEFLQALADEVRSACGKETPKFNSVLVRLYLVAFPLVLRIRHGRVLTLVEFPLPGWER